jgi:hypothetical protein
MDNNYKKYIVFTKNKISTLVVCNLFEISTTFIIYDLNAAKMTTLNATMLRIWRYP